MRARILVRTAVDWRRMDHASFQTQQTASTAPNGPIRKSIRARLPTVFQEVFGFDFFDFRQQLQDISMDCLRAVRGVELSCGFSDFHDWFARADDEMIFPIDDDDLFRPDLREAASACREAAVVIWKFSAYGHAPSGTAFSTHVIPGRLLFSNNWGVRKSFLKETMSAKKAERVLSSHADAWRFLMAHFGISRDKGGDWGGLSELDTSAVHYTDRHYSLQLWHPAALTHAMWFTGGSDASATLRSRYEALEKPPDEPNLEQGLAWASPYAKRYTSLVNKLWRSST